jgi:hypothetical protein
MNMAYMDFQAGSALEVAETHHDLLEALVAQADFSPLEWTVISLARHDRSDAGSLPAELRRIMTLLFGERIARPLANARLEALRQAAVAIWNRRPLAEPDVAAFDRAGFTSGHLNVLRMAISSERQAAA